MRLLIQLLGLVVSCIAIALVLSQIDVGETAEVLARASMPPLLVAGTALTAQIGILAARWRILLPANAFGATVPYRTVVEALLIGNLANATLPARLGEVARTIFVARRGAVDAAGSAGTVVLERILDVTVLTAVAVIAAVSIGVPGLVSQTLGLIALGGIAVLALLISGIVPRIVQRLATRTQTRFLDRPTVAPGLRWASRLLEGLHAGRRPAVVVEAGGATVGSVLLDGAIFWSVGASLGLELGAAEAMLLAAAAVLVTGIPSGPASIGTFELAASFVAVSLGIAAESGLALAFVAHAIIVVPPSVAGVVVLLRSTRRASDAASPAETMDGVGL